jgi:hypothetical protein
MGSTSVHETSFNAYLDFFVDNKVNMNFYFYYTGAISLCFICALALFERLGNKKNPLFFSNTFYLTAVSIFLIINKLSYFDMGVVDSDESLMLSAGRTFGLDPRPWISVDPSTSGPLNFLPATLLIKLVENASYGELRLFYAIAFQIPTVIILFLTASKVAGHFKARLAIIPLILCFTFFYYFAHMHASSEQFPMLFTAVGVSTLILISFQQVKRPQLILTGALCALGPFAKLQVGPLLFFLCFVCFVFLIVEKKRWKDAAWLTAGFTMTGLLALLIIHSYGGFYDFFQSYIGSSMTYIGNHNAKQSLDFFIERTVTAVMPLFLFVTFTFFWTVGGIRSMSKFDYLYLISWTLVLFVAAYCVIKPGRLYPHYGLLLIVPLYGCFLWAALRSGKFTAKLTPYFLSGIGILLLYNVSKTSTAFSGFTRHQVANVEVLNLLAAESKPTDRLAVWGWGGPYIHEAKLLMGTRDLHYDYQTSYFGPIGDYYKNRFLSDLKQNRPKWFLDISQSPDFGGSAQNALDNFSKINDFVMANYVVAYSSRTATLFRNKSKR